MNHKIVDPASEIFLEELEDTKRFTDSVIKDYGFLYNSDPEINIRIQEGLTRNKILYGKRYCPCFFVTQNDEENRICPCKPALEDDIPNKGSCHCGIFTSENCNYKYETDNLSIKKSNKIEEYNKILKAQDIDSYELEQLLDAREKGEVEFKLVDVREDMEYARGRIKGVDYLIPTSRFYDEIKKLDKHKNIPIIVYCHIGSRSFHCQQILKKMGLKVINLDGGIASYGGSIVRI